VVAAAAALLALVVIAAPVGCVTAQEVGAGDAQTSCTSLAGLPTVIALPVIVVRPVAAWMFVVRH
jgi:hypothetical protein